jgi:hypothetical protein
LAFACAIMPVGLVVASWLPLLGLVDILAETGQGVEREIGPSEWSPAVAFHQALTTPVPHVLEDSLLLGLVVGVGVVVLGGLLRPGPGVRLAPGFGSRLVSRLAVMPPIVQGVGVLAMLELGQRALRASGGFPGLWAFRSPVAARVSDLFIATDHWPSLTIAVGLSVGTRLLVGWRREAERQAGETRSSLDAALVSGSSVFRARYLSAIHPRRWVGTLILAGALGAVNLAPALLFVPLLDGGTVAPAMLVLADGPPAARLQAATLACFVIAGHIAGLCAARLAPSPPPEWDPDPA